MDACMAGDASRDDDEDGGEAEAEDALSPPELQKAWQAEVAVVKRLRQQGLAPEHPAMLAACAARDEAERSWREAKDPTPVSVRLSRAQAKLDRAISLQAESRRAVIECEREHKERMAGLQSKVDEDMERVRLRRRQLELVQAEVGAEGLGRASTEQGEAVRQVHGAICNQLAPTIAALVEQLDSASPAWAALNGILGTLTTSKDLLERAISPSPAARTFNIGDGDGGGDRADDAYADGEPWDGSEWSESHDLPARGARSGGGEEQWGDDHDAGRAWPPEQGDPMDCSEWWGAPSGQWSAGVRWQPCGYGKWARESWADQSEEAWAEDGASAGQPAATRRRLELAAPTPAAVSDDAADSEAAEAAQRKKRHSERVSQIVLQAIDAGIQPLTSAGEELHMLDAHQLDAWISEHFPAALAR